MERVKTGILGEDLAANYLSKKGYTILLRNFHTRWAELDIIATKDTTVVFVEVKTRTSTAFGTPAEAVTFSKIQKLQRSIEIFYSKHPNLSRNMRLDVIAIILDKNGEITSLDHIESVTSY